MRNLSFASRVLLVAFVPALLVAVLMGLYSVVYAVRDGEKSELQRASTLAQSLARAVEFGVATENLVVLEEATKPILALPSVSAVRFFGNDDTEVYKAIDANHQQGDISHVAGFVRSLISNRPLANMVWAPIERTDLTLYKDPLFDEVDTGTGNSALERVGHLELDVDLSLAYEGQYDTFRRVSLYVALVLLIALAAAFRLTRSVIVPVRSLTSSVRSLARNEYVHVPATGIGGELDELADGINFLSGELQSFHAKQHESIRLATVGLQSTLSLLEQKNAELELARESAETASAFKSQFVANMSHEIRTPLNTIIGTLSVLNKEGLDITQVDQINMIKNSSNTLLYLIEDILDISKIESGNLVVESIATNLEYLLSDITSTAAMQAVEKGVDLHIDPVPDLALRNVYTDPHRLKQVLVNLLSNAIKFTDLGHVSLITTLLDSEPGYRLVRFSVEDTGIGIPDDKQDSLFSAFTQVDMSTTRRYGGTGLGLFISKGIVELLGGNMVLHSTEGEGTRIDVELPFKVSMQAIVQPPRLPETEDLFSYEDTYKPLCNANRRLLKLAFGSLPQSDQSLEEGRVFIKNIPNRMLASSWIGPMEPVGEPGASDSLPAIAWVSQMNPVIKSRIQQAGYGGFVVKTPSLRQLGRHLQSALAGHSFSHQSGLSLTDDRPAKLNQALTVLAVDDQRLNIDLLMQYFDYLDVRGLYAASGSEALAYIDSESIDLVLLDLHMPEQDGFEVVKQIREGGSINARVPVIAMTADAYQATREQALSAGFDSLLTKPATVKQVSEAINQWVSSGREERAEPGNAMIDVQRCAVAVRGNEEWVRGALRTYADEVPGHVANIRSATQQYKADAVFEVAHAVKGVSRVFNIKPVADAAEALEKASQDGDWAAIDLAAQKLETLLLQAANECNTLLA